MNLPGGLVTEKTFKTPVWQLRVFGLCFGVFLLLALEGAARIFYTPSLLDNIMVVLEEDVNLLWRQKPHLNTMFEGAKIVTNGNGFRIGQKEAKESVKTPAVQDEKKLKIICMGASPDFGWGVEFEHIYSSVLQRRLHKKGYKNTSVTNVAGIGYSSWQGKKLLARKVLKMSPDIITVPFVINDIDKYRFFQSQPVADKDLKPLSPLLVWGKNMAVKSVFFHMFSRLLFKAMWARSGVWKNEDKNTANRQLFFRPGPNRVGLEDYKNNLLDMFRMASAQGIKVMFVKFPVNLPAPERVTQKNRVLAQKELSRAMVLLEAENFDSALTHLGKALALDPYCSNAWYWQGFCLEKQNNAAGAEKSFEKARASEVFKCGLDAKAYNNAMQQVAVQNDIALCNVVAAFEGLNPDELFLTKQNDPIHPSRQGHSIIAASLFDALLEHKLLPAR